MYKSLRYKTKFTSDTGFCSLVGASFFNLENKISIKFFIITMETDKTVQFKINGITH